MSSAASSSLVPSLPLSPPLPDAPSSHALAPPCSTPRGRLLSAIKLDADMAELTLDGPPQQPSSSKASSTISSAAASPRRASERARAFASQRGSSSSSISSVGDDGVFMRLGKKIGHNYALVSVHLELPRTRFVIYLQENSSKFSLTCRYQPIIEAPDDEARKAVIKDLVTRLHFDESGKVVMDDEVRAMWVSD